ncbi:MAG TPA: pyruvate kinase alpha/beta domain-containing protein, partial [Urbifossiella sp.]
VMLSGETAVGKYPLEAISCMHRIAVETETHLEQSGVSLGDWFNRPSEELDDPVTLAACELASEVCAAAIVVPTLTGRLAKLVVRHRPWARVVAVAPIDLILQELALVWGVIPVRMTPTPPGGDRLTTAVRDAFLAGTVHPGERIIVLAGHPIEGGPRFPTVHIVRVGEGGTSVEP